MKTFLMIVLTVIVSIALGMGLEAGDVGCAYVWGLGCGTGMLLMLIAEN
ncbi:MAG: hypothetical protein V3U60_11290 [Gammaproteobacteria bacterium]